MKSPPGNEAAPYALGHADRELDRLSVQAQALEPATRQFFLDAGLGPGMRVLDVGCGAGEVSLLAAAIVGPTGEVIGIDKAEAAISRAGKRAAERGLSHVRFRHCDVLELDPDEPFDAVVGRLVLMYFADPADVLRRLARLLRPGGILAFQEFDIEAARAVPSVPLVGRCLDLVNRTFAAAGAEARMGIKLRAAFMAAGLPPPVMRLDGVLGGGPDFIVYPMLAEVVRTLLPLAERFGIASAAEAGIDTLADRLRAECVERDAILVIPEIVGAWSRTRG